MLIRFVIENVLSFGSRKEFLTIPNKRLKTLQHHVYKLDGFEILKLSAIYGANGSGKSNLIKALSQLQILVTGEESSFKRRDSRFKFGSQKEQTLAIEFIQEETPLYYGLVFTEDCIVREELYLSGLGKKADKLLFERKNGETGTSLRFLDAFEQDEKSQVLKTVLLEEFIKPDEPVLRLLSKRENVFLRDVKKAFHWFSDTLQIITPDAKPSALAHKIDTDGVFKKYAEDLMCSFQMGITGLGTEKKSIQAFFGEDNIHELDRWIEAVERTPKKRVSLRSRRGEEVILVKEKETIWVKTLQVEHTAGAQKTYFDLEEESDGTIRLLDFVPAFQQVISSPKVYVVDEIERSIHPLLIKELVKKFSLDRATRGQLVFTTHESHLLDQEIFRQDEIWFTEKDSSGSTDLYALSDFKEHKTIDIRKGYLTGRYGSIPFLGNLEDLNWHSYDFNESLVREASTE